MKFFNIFFNFFLFWPPIFFSLHEPLHFEKFKSVDFKYSNSVFQILAQKYPEKSFLVLNLKPFHFGRNFAIPQIVGCWFQIWKQLLKIAAQKYPNKTTFGSNLVFCVLHETLHIEKLKGADFKYDNIFFSNSALKHPNDTILVPGLSVFLKQIFSNLSLLISNLVIFFSRKFQPSIAHTRHFQWEIYEFFRFTGNFVRTLFYELKSEITI